VQCWVSLFSAGLADQLQRAAVYRLMPCCKSVVWLIFITPPPSLSYLVDAVLIGMCIGGIIGCQSGGVSARYSGASSSLFVRRVMGFLHAASSYYLVPTDGLIETNHGGLCAAIFPDYRRFFYRGQLHVAGEPGGTRQPRPFECGTGAAILSGLTIFGVTSNQSSGAANNDRSEVSSLRRRYLC